MFGVLDLSIAKRPVFLPVVFHQNDDNILRQNWGDRRGTLGYLCIQTFVWQLSPAPAKYAHTPCLLYDRFPNNFRDKLISGFSALQLRRNSHFPKHEIPLSSLYVQSSRWLVCSLMANALVNLFLRRVYLFIFTSNVLNLPLTGFWYPSCPIPRP